jgi:hypothetical protein
LTDQSNERMTQQEFEAARRSVRRSFLLATVAYIGVAVFLFSRGATIFAVVLFTAGAVGTPIILRKLDRDWKKQGYEIP